MDSLIAIFAGVFILGLLKGLIPLVVQLADAILLMILRAPFRWLAHRFRTRAQLSPYQRGLRRGSEGAWLSVSAVYAATWFPVLLGKGLAELAGDFWRAPADHPGVGVYFVALALGLIWVGAGIRDARGGERDWLAAFWGAVIAGSCLAALWWHWFPSPDRTFTTLLEIAAAKTFYIATAAAGLVRLWLTMPMLGGGNALRRILRHIENRARRLRPARPRSF